MAPATGMVVTFRNHVIPDEIASKAQGRPIFKDMEVCDIRLAGQKALYTFPAHEADPNATREAGDTVTYAQRYNEQYRAFKANEVQPDGGTPLSEAPFLSEGKRRELKAMNVRTVETLAAIDGTPLKQLGMGGREMKMQAQAYLEKAAGSSDVTAMAATIASLQQQLEDQRELMGSHLKKAAKTKYQRAVEKSVAEAEADGDGQEDDVEVARTYNASDWEQSSIVSPADKPDWKPAGSADENDVPVAVDIEDMTDTQLKAFIKEQTNEPVRGNPSRETLIARVNDLLAG